jgi:hypothetical protein
MFYTITKESMLYLASVVPASPPGGGAAKPGAERNVSSDYISIEEAAHRSGLHSNTLKRLLRTGAIYGYKATVQGRSRWLVSAASLRLYADPIDGFLLDMPGPKLYLRRVDDDEYETG